MKNLKVIMPKGQKDNSGKFKKSWLAKVASNKQCIYHLTIQLPFDQKAFYFVEIQPKMEAEFLKTVNNGDINEIHHYCRVLESGLGTPDDSILKKIKEIHGCLT